MQPTPQIKEVAAPNEQTVEVAPVQNAGGCEQFRPLVGQYDWDAGIALAIMQAESSCNPRAYNGTLNSDGSNDAGLFQINSIHDNTDARFDPATNVRLAYKVYTAQGWRAWSVYNNGAYQKFL